MPEHAAQMPPDLGSTDTDTGAGADAGTGTASPLCRTALGFDFGRARIGVAVGTALTGTARPLSTLNVRQQRPDWTAIARLITEWQPDWLVVGVPYHADGNPSSLTAAALHFSRQLHRRFGLPVATVDERLSSWAAEQRYAEGNARRRGRDPGADAGAAAVILETGLTQITQHSDDPSRRSPR